LNARSHDLEAIRRIVRSSLEEDLGSEGDITSLAAIEPDSRAVGHLVARQELVAAGIEVAREVFRQLDPKLAFEEHCRDGDVLERGERLATVEGNARAILAGERTALNFLMRMCGIATATRAAVEEVAGTGAVVLDTRKTAPGLRLLDKWAVSIGGGSNHRMGLYDAAMVKDTHLAAAGSIERAVRSVLEQGTDREKITAEVRTIEELEEAIRAGAGRALLDNMDLETMKEAVRRAAGRIILEASGSLRPGNLRAVARTGVDCLSLGWLTHSAPAADLAMETEPLA
jgi:nicotinate-nucleotide pyrophosphorylase (carboxylating)